MKEYDVVVVGAGLAGLHCALLLARSGVRTLLVDHKRYLSERIHTTGIFVRRTLEDFQLPESCLSQPIRRVTLCSPSCYQIKLESDKDEFRVGRMGALYLHLLNRCLDAGVEWSAETTYETCCTSSRGTIIHLRSKKSTWQHRSRFVVGADGARSRVGRDLKLDQNHEWIIGVEDVFRDIPASGEPGLHCFFDPHLAPGYLAWVVHDGEELHLGIGGYAALFNPIVALEKFSSMVGSLFHLESGRWIERRGGEIPVNGVLNKISCEHGLLIGDAAGAVSPLTAGGLDACLRLSTLAAHVLGSILNDGDNKLMELYSGRRFRSRFISRRWMRKILRTVRTPFWADLFIGLLQLPTFRPIARHIFFGRGSFPDVGAELNRELSFLES